MKLKNKLTLSITSILIVTGLLEIFGFSLYLRRKLISDIKFSLKTLAISAETLSEFPLINYDYPLLKRNIESIFHKRLSYILVYDSRGVMVSSAYKEEFENAIMDRKVNIAQEKLTHSKEVILHNKKFYEISVPVKPRGFEAPIGVIKIGVLKKEIDSTATNVVFYIVLFILFSIILATLALYFISSTFTKPITQLSKASEEIAKGNFSTKIPRIESKDELGKLSDSFTKMAEKIEKTMSELESYEKELEDKIKERTDKLKQAMKKLEETRDEIEKANRISRMNKVISEISHNINNPISIILANIEMLKRERSVEKDSIRLEKMESAAKRVSSLIEKMNIIASEETKFRELTDIIDMLKELRDEFNNERIEFILPEGKKLMSANKDYLKEAMVEIIKNSLEAIEGIKDGKVEVKLSENETSTTIEIKDNGKGMTESVLRKAIDPFFTTSENKKGLGLTMASNIIQSHKGKLKIISKPGEGTTVKIIFEF